MKNALFGEGTYLSQDPSISLHYSPSGKTWDNSIIGQRMSCLLVCETINDPKFVRTGLNGIYFSKFK
jgi:poly [ADP-ribose] polymerase 16